MKSISGWLRLFLLNRKGIYAKPATRRTILAAAFLLLYMIVLAADFTSDRVSVEEGEVSERDIVAPRTVSYVDSVKTKELVDDVLASVVDVYDLDTSTLARAEDSVNIVFNALNAQSAEPAEAKDQAAELERKRAALDAVTSVELSRESKDILTSLDKAGLEKTKETALGLLRRALQRGVHADEVELTKKHIGIEIADMELSKEQKFAAGELVERLIAPNMTLNVKETEKRKQAAAASVDPVRETIRKGQVIVRRGDIITQRQILMMGEVGLHKGQVNQFRSLGLFVYVLLVASIVMAFLYKFEPKIYRNDLLLALLGLIALIALILAKVAYYYSFFAGPAATGALLAAILINPRVGLMLSVAIAMLLGVMVNYDLRAVASALLGSMVGVYSVAKMAHGYSLTRTGIWISLVNVLTIGTLGLMADFELAQLLLECLLGVVAGIGSAIITTGVLPYLEHAFNITTPIKLLELGQSNHPLLQRLLLEAPGTYHHSVLLGNLAEAGADVIGADPVTVRVGAYYHDVGKIKRPYFFVENQFGAENPHDKIAPSLSALILISHVRDGLELCREYKLPKVISDIVRQHHGTLLASFFYRKAQELEHGECVQEADFRYEGPKPQTKEAALIMIADACEAAVRSINKPNANRIEAMVKKIIRERLNDGQFDECNLTLRDLTKIGDVYARILSSMFHSRIEYPETIKDIERKNKTDGNHTREIPARIDGAAERGGDDPKSDS